jgi:hypothetical protein
MPTATKTKPTEKTTPAKRVAKKVAVVPPTPVRVKRRGQIQVRLPQPLIDRIDSEAERRRVSKTFLVEQILDTAIGKWEEQELLAV